MARLFIGFPLPERVARRLGEESDRLRFAGARVGWVKPELMHVTLRFLGDVADRDLPELHSVLQTEVPGTGVLKLVAKGLGTFPPAGTPRVVWCGIAGATEEEGEELRDLRRRLDAAVRDMGFRREKGRYVPHATLGRVRGPRGAAELLERLAPAARREFGHFEIGEVVLYESRLRPDGPEYTPLESVSLA